MRSVSSVQLGTSRGSLLRNDARMNPIEPPYSDDSPQINEEVWQAWRSKHDRKDKSATARRFRILQAVLVIVFLAAAIWIASRSHF